MPDGKPDIGEDLSDDPFEGLEIGEDAPEPTQEEMDEWATLDTSDEDASPTHGAEGKGPAAEPVATSVPTSSAPNSEPQNKSDDKEEVFRHNEERQQEPADKPQNNEPAPASASAVAASPELKSESLPSSEVAALPSPSAPATEVGRSAGLSEISPAASPPPLQRSANDQSYAAGAGVGGDDEEDGVDERGGLQQEEQHLLQDEQQRQSGGGGWGVGWGSSWGLGVLGGKLREVAAGAVRDVKDLTETFQAALADVTGAEDEIEQAGRISAMDRAAEAAEAGGAAAEDSVGEAEEGGPALPTDAPLQVAGPAREGPGSAAGSITGITRAARGDSAGGARGSSGGAGEPGPRPPADPALEAGLQAIDAQVEQLATGAARAFSSLWGGLSSVAKVVAAEVVASVADVQSSEAVRGVAQIGTKLAHTAERGLETVGRTAMVLLEEVAGVGGGGGAGRRRIWGEEADARAADMGREPASFKDFFYIYGGEQLAEEVNILSNECAHLCNKSRSKLEGEQQQALDEALARMGPYFNDPWISAAPEAGTASAPELDAGSKEAAEQLGQMYDPIGYLCQDSMSRSEAFLHQLLKALEAARAVETSAAVPPGRHRSKPLADEAQEGGDDDDEEDADEEQAALHRAERQSEPRVLLDSFRAHFTKRLAEVATAQLQLLLNLGASLAAPARTGRPAVDGIAWPDSSEQQAALLAAEARRMVADLQTLTGAYVATINALRSPLPPADQDGSCDVGGQGAVDNGAEVEVTEAKGAPAAVDGTVLAEMEAALAANSESATASIKGGYKGLLYAVLLRSLVTQIAQEQHQQDAGEAGQAAGKNGDDA